MFARITPAGLTPLDAVLPGHLALIERWLTGPLTAEQLDGLLTGLRIVRDGSTTGRDRRAQSSGTQASGASARSA